jgi:hypothetical protein
MPGDCAGPLKKEKRMVICAPSARGKGNCVPLISRLFRPSSELVFGPSRKFGQKIDRIELVETGLLLFRHSRRPAAGCRGQSAPRAIPTLS